MWMSYLRGAQLNKTYHFSVSLALWETSIWCSLFLHHYARHLTWKNIALFAWRMYTFSSKIRNEILNSSRKPHHLRQKSVTFFGQKRDKITLSIVILSLLYINTWIICIGFGFKIRFRRQKVLQRDQNMIIFSIRNTLLKYDKLEIMQAPRHLYVQ